MAHNIGQKKMWSIEKESARHTLLDRNKNGVFEIKSIITYLAEKNHESSLNHNVFIFPGFTYPRSCVWVVRRSNSSRGGGFSTDQLEMVKLGDTTLYTLKKKETTSQNATDIVGKFQQSFEVVIFFDERAPNMDYSIKLPFDLPNANDDAIIQTLETALDTFALKFEYELGYKNFNGALLEKYGKLTKIYQGGSLFPCSMIVESGSPNILRLDAGHRASPIILKKVTLEKNNIFNLNEKIMVDAPRTRIPLTFQTEKYVRTPIGLFLKNAASCHMISERGILSERLLLFFENNVVKNSWSSKINFLTVGNQLVFFAGFIPGYPQPNKNIYNVVISLSGIVEID